MKMEYREVNKDINQLIMLFDGNNALELTPIQLYHSKPVLPLSNGENVSKLNVKTLKRYYFNDKTQQMHEEEV